MMPAPKPDSNAAEAPDPGGITLVKQTRSIPVIVVDHVNEKPKE